MKNLIFITLLTVLASSCATRVASTSVDAPVASDCQPYFAERLRAYFDLHEVKADQILNNDSDSGPLKSGTETIKIGRHEIEWIDSIQGMKAESKVRINDELILLNGEQSVNAADGEAKIDMQVVAEWRQVKLYKLLDQELIAVGMGPKSCTGLMCGVGAQLWYDVKSKQKTFFGTYRTDFDVRLFRFTNDNLYQLVSTNFAGDPHGTTGSATITYELYELQPDGKFQIRKNAAARKYFIKLTSFPDSEFDGDRVRKLKRVKPDSLEQNWIEKLWP